MRRKAPADYPLPDEIESLLRTLDAADLALGGHLLDRVRVESGGLNRGSPLFDAAWCRAQVAEWCQAECVREAFGDEAVGSTAMAVEHMEDDLMLALARDLVRQAAAHNTRKPAPTIHQRARRRIG